MALPRQTAVPRAGDFIRSLSPDQLRYFEAIESALGAALARVDELEGDARTLAERVARVEARERNRLAGS